MSIYKSANYIYYVTIQPYIGRRKIVEVVGAQSCAGLWGCVSSEKKQRKLQLRKYIIENFMMLATMLIRRRR